jgi:peptidyl-prolyl cis-trans isomerase SurA
MVSGTSFGQGQSGTSIDKIIARVDNHYILKSEVESWLESLKARGERVDKCSLLERVIINKMLLAKAEIDSVEVEDKEIEAELAGRMDMMIRQYGSAKNITESLGKSIDALKQEYKQEVKDQRIIETMQGKIAGDVKITPHEVKKFFNSIPKDSLPFIPSEVQIGHIVRYATVTREQKEKLRTELLEIKKKIQEGQDFAELAQIYSEDVESAKIGGDVGYAKRGAMVPEYEGAALALKPGELSNIVESQYGFHLIQLLETRGAEYHTRHILLRPDYNKGTDVTEATRYLDSLRTLIQTDSISFVVAAKDNSEDKNTADAGGLIQDPQTQLTTLPLDASMDMALYFAIDTMNVGDISKPLAYRTDDGRSAMRIIWYKDKTEPHTISFSEDYERLARYALEFKKNSAMEEWFKKAQDDVFISVEPEYQTCKIFGVTTTDTE